MKRENFLPLSLTVALVVLSLVLPYRAPAQGIFNFGGLIYATIPCTCSGNFIIIVGQPKGGVFAFQSGVTRPYAWGAFHPGAWVLGNYVPGAVCLQWAGKKCIPNPIYPIGTMTIVGTSV